MALDPQALVSLTEVRTYLQVEASDKPSDGLLEQVVGGLSLRVLQHTGQTYINPVAADAAATRLYRFDPISDAVVPVDNCRSITKVEVTATPNESGSWATVDADIYVAEPLGEAVIDRLRFLEPADLPAQGSGWGALGLHQANAGPISGGTPWPNQARAQIAAQSFIRVTAKYGYGKDLSTVPANVKLAVLMWLQNIHKRDAAFFGEQAKVIAKIAMPEDVRELLDGEAAAQPSVVAV